MRLRHLFALAIVAIADTALAQGVNLISSVEVKDEGASVVLSVKGTKPPNFTTFSMADLATTSWPAVAAMTPTWSIPAMALARSAPAIR